MTGWDSTTIVVGSAVAGSAVANALGALGVETLVLEKGFEKENSARGDFLHPPTLRFLDCWGVLERIFEDGALPIYHLAVSHRTLGRLATYDLQAQGEGLAGRTIAVPHDRIATPPALDGDPNPSRTTRAAAILLVFFRVGPARIPARCPRDGSACASGVCAGRWPRPFPTGSVTGGTTRAPRWRSGRTSIWSSTRGRGSASSAGS